ncbi:3-deoxy-D-manno-octulosonic acid transferase [Sphingobacterium alkalisoli]|uniref:3-deoxy-D-manno-octulosonic acid transferase n=1 Tax=Sphingobacterium alkalisoli TaxID=1874115 RepID=A0A4U0H8M7_9SPHI|nr:glycosyltransferase N-terminal domain-containing protein [Sphingobacterium alkalisoli]TJY68190.1 3-deoxy-D-manno-octulosonic acid transferase [Sphingobacterium alkalisoli]GGH08414.1 3-deoxy-D-manno-octulosonic acid transferase [Sphingobacterium alkalisoli]
MRILYDLGIVFYGMILRLIAPFHTKAQRWVDGRKGLLKHIKHTVEKGQEHIWFHFASLGEFEQGRAVLEQIRKKYPHEKIVITFFSPSGYEIRKNTTLADYVFYLPEDSARNARDFLEAINPKFAIFTKYEYWYHYFNQLHKRKTRLLLISAIFREEQLFFKPYGGFYRSILKKVTFFFTQNMDSVHMLKWIGITHAGLAGDTRFDRVVELPKKHQEILPIKQFVGNQHVLVAGSTWPTDEALLQQLAIQYPLWKFIVAPHEVNDNHIHSLLKLFPQAIKFSEFSSYTAAKIEAAQILLIDNIGMLSSLYYYGDVAYIGGGFGVGIHNTLEAATYGMPIIFGPKYEKFQEAVDLVTLTAGFSIANYNDLQGVFRSLNEQERRKICGEAASAYVKQRAGATQIIMKYLETEKLLG